MLEVYTCHWWEEHSYHPHHKLLAGEFGPTHCGVFGLEVLAWLVRGDDSVSLRF